MSHQHSFASNAWLVTLVEHMENQEFNFILKYYLFLLDKPGRLMVVDTMCSVRQGKTELCLLNHCFSFLGSSMDLIPFNHKLPSCWGFFRDAFLAVCFAEA